jgi:hypothetical protein
MRRKHSKEAIAMGIVKHSVSDDIVLTVTSHVNDDHVYAAYDAAGEPIVSFVAEELLDLVPWLAARRLLVQGLDPDRMLVVKLVGADYLMLHCTLGQAAATPLPNLEHPVFEPMTCMYRREINFHD